MNYRVYTDIETGGMNMYRQAIIQLAAVCPGSNETFERKIKFKPENADAKALELNSYDPDVWAAEAVTPMRAAKEYAEYLKRHASVRQVSKRTGKEYYVAQLVAYNGKKFDGPWLQQWYKRLKLFLPASYKVLDPMALAEFCLPDLEDHKLATVAKHFGVHREDAHDALADVYMLIDVTKRLEEMIHRE